MSRETMKMCSIVVIRRYGLQFYCGNLEYFSYIVIELNGSLTLIHLDHLEFTAIE